MKVPLRNVFGSGFLPGKAKKNRHDAIRAMKRNYGGTVATPINDDQEVWDGEFNDSVNPLGDTSTSKS